jgi:hypothetical protein
MQKTITMAVVVGMSQDSSKKTIVLEDIILIVQRGGKGTSIKPFYTD